MTPAYSLISVHASPVHPGAPGFPAGYSLGLSPPDASACTQSAAAPHHQPLSFVPPVLFSVHGACVSAAFRFVSESAVLKPCLLLVKYCRQLPAVRLSQSYFLFPLPALKYLPLESLAAASLHLASLPARAYPLSFHPRSVDQDPEHSFSQTPLYPLFLYAPAAHPLSAAAWCSVYKLPAPRHT